ncbi:hypothetical protein [Fibrella forsythiae]|uniref:Uncharacterized protein n=1 Tax=Fibrella forsythiae TaxID=2817061 RepID=A0ABS3JRJ3_9BACT|nr:hypothetical protein [Fibrella forsythiae]MBO0951824.1 hypothetical protein [Fibrella forsythiae]
MDMKAATFTLDVKGLELPEDVRQEISLALNNTLMRKLGEINLTGKTNGGAAATGGNGLFGKVIRIDGGDWSRLINRHDFGPIFQRTLDNKQVLGAGIEQINQTQVGK